jgi:hypothetical protein
VYYLFKYINFKLYIFLFLNNYKIVNKRIIKVILIKIKLFIIIKLL